MLAVIIIFLCVVCRLLPLPPNFAPIGATAVFSGRVFPFRYALALTFIAMLVADFFLSKIHGYAFISGVTFFVYAGFMLQVFLGRSLRKYRGGLFGAALSGAVFFFVISNFGVWLVSGLYPPNSVGLIACYIAAIPFFGATLLGDLVWTAALWFAYRKIASKYEDLGPIWVPESAQKIPLF